MEENMRNKIILAVILLLGAFAAGRWLAPTKVVTEIKTVEVEKKTEATDTSKEKIKKTTTTVTERPDGTKETKTTVTEDIKSDKKTKETDESSRTKDESKTVERTGDKVTISLLGGIRLGEIADSGAIVYGASITKPILGPLTVGIFGLTNGVVGCSVGITF
jgi:hypothetical protein